MNLKWPIIENIVIYLAIAAITLGGLWLCGGWWGLCSLVLLIWVNTFKSSSKSEDK